MRRSLFSACHLSYATSRKVRTPFARLRVTSSTSSFYYDDRAHYRAIRVSSHNKRTCRYKSYETRRRHARLFTSEPNVVDLDHVRQFTGIAPYMLQCEYLERHRTLLTSHYPHNIQILFNSSIPTYLHRQSIKPHTKTLPFRSPLPKSDHRVSEPAPSPNRLPATSPPRLRLNSVLEHHSYAPSSRFGATKTKDCIDLRARRLRASHLRSIRSDPWTHKR